MAVPNINNLPEGPSPSDSPDVFNQKAFAFVDALPTFSVQMNAAIDAINEGGGGGGSGTVTSVGLQMPLAFFVSDSPITGSGTIIVEMSPGYSIPSDSAREAWDFAYSRTGQWTGESTNLNAEAGRASLELGNVAQLDANTIGQNIIQASNPGAIRFGRANADNTWSWLDAAGFRSAIGAGKKVALLTVSTSTHNVDSANESAYHRFTFSGAKSVTVRPNSTHALPTDGSFVFRNANTGNLTVTAGSGVTINVPNAGTLVLEPGMTVTLQKVGTNEYDLIGHTVAA